MRQFLLLLTLSSISLVSVPSSADPVCPLIYGSCGIDACTLDQQKTYVESLLYAVEKLDRAIPSPSPREMDWLEKEYAAGGDRGIEASMSVEGRKRNVRIPIEVLRRELVRLLEQIEAGDNPKYRVLLWINVASILADSSWVSDVTWLRERGVGGLVQRNLDGIAPDEGICAQHASTILEVVKRELHTVSF